MHGSDRCRSFIALTGLIVVGCNPPASDDGEPETGTASATESATESGSTETKTETESGSTETETETGAELPPRPARVVLTSDWREHRLSLLDYEALRDGAATRDEALWKAIELPGHEPGPLEAELTPDGRLAVVAIGPGFFAGQLGGLVNAANVPEGGGLLIVDVETDAILAELQTAQYPMGVAISDDGTSAWTANYGGNGQSGMTMSHVDLVDYSLIEELEIGPGPEQLALRGDLAIINTAGDGSVRLFDITDAQATISAPAVVAMDPSWVLFVGPDDTRAVSVNSIGPGGYSLVDTSDPLAPQEIDEVEVVGIPYAGARGSVDTELVMSVLIGTEISVQRWDTLTSTLIDEIIVPHLGFPLGIAFVPEDELALVPIPGANVLAVLDFGTGEQWALDYEGASGPTYVAIESP